MWLCYHKILFTKIGSRPDLAYRLYFADPWPTKISAVYNVGRGFVIYGLYYVEESSLYAYFLQGFYHKN